MCHIFLSIHSRCVSVRARAHMHVCLLVCLSLHPPSVCVCVHVYMLYVCEVVHTHMCVHT